MLVYSVGFHRIHRGICLNEIDCEYSYSEYTSIKNVFASAACSINSRFLNGADPRLRFWDCEKMVCEWFIRQALLLNFDYIGFQSTSRSINQPISTRRFPQQLAASCIPSLVHVEPVPPLEGKLEF